MSEVTLKAIEQLLDLKLDEKLDKKLDEKLAPISKIQVQHSGQLDGIAKDVKTLLEEKPVTGRRLDRLENWGEKVGLDTGIKLEL